MQRIRYKLTYILTAALIAVIAIFTSWLSGWDNPAAYADTSKTYSDVLTDLQKDTSFNASNYPVVAKDYSLQIIQIAESSNNELFIYVYQPSGQAKKLTACSINISTMIDDEISFYNYKLKLLSYSNVFYKYLVKDFTVENKPIRHYAISSIYRPFDSTIDTNAEHGNTITEVNYAINKQYSFGTINGNPYCKVVDIETIEITDKFVGFVRYKDGFKLYASACDSHFVAFNTDKPIDRLFEADVYYTKQSYGWSVVSFGGEKEEFGEKTDEYAYLKYTDKVTHTGDGLFAGTYKWDRIETVTQFLSENDITQTVYSGAILDVSVANKITDEGKAALEGKKWVLRFAETSYRLNGGSGWTTENTTLVGDVTILRLKFETDGITYNLGVIDNKQTGSGKPINEETIKVSVNSKGKWILALILLILLIILLFPFLPTIANVLVAIFKWLWKVIKAPFKAIAAAVKGAKNKSEK